MVGLLDSRLRGNDKMGCHSPMILSEDKIIGEYMVQRIGDL